MKKLLCALLIMVFVSAALFAASAGEKVSNDPRPGKMIWSIGNTLTSADAHMWDVNGDNQIHLVYIEGLIKDDGWNHYSPALAESWEISDDGLTYVFHLRKGVTFHSGDAFTADDVIFSANRLIAATGGSIAGHLSNMVSIEAQDDYTVKMVFKSASPTLFFDLAYLRIYSRKQAERDGENFYEKFVGTGPYKFVEWKVGESITFEKNENWWGTFADGAPTVIEHRPIPEEATRVAALLSGEVDVLPGISQESEEQLTGSFYSERTPGVSCIDLVMKNDKAPFSSSAFRLALDYLIPREEIVNDLVGMGTPANIWSQDSYPWFPPELKGVIRPYDEAKAKQLIAESGYNGEPIKIMTRKGNSAKDVEICEYIASLWRNVGINVSVDVVASSAFSSARSAGEYDLYMTAWDIASPGYYYKDKYKSHKINRALVDPAFEELVEAAYSETDEAKYNAIVMDIERLLFEDPATLHIYYPQYVWGCSGRIQILAYESGYTKIEPWRMSLSKDAR